MTSHVNFELQSTDYADYTDPDIQGCKRDLLLLSCPRLALICVICVICGFRRFEMRYLPTAVKISASKRGSRLNGFEIDEKYCR